MKSQVQKARNIQGFIADAKVYLNEERGTLVHRLPDNMKIEMPINLYKRILNLPFEKKEKTQDQKNSGTRTNIFGLVARPAIYLTKDGQYLIHRVLGILISKPTNYYKVILSSKSETLAQSLPA